MEGAGGTGTSRIQLNLRLRCNLLRLFAGRGMIIGGKKGAERGGFVTLHLIGNAHIDPVWLWRWQEGFSEILSTFRSALDRMKEFPDFRFTSACAVYYEWVRKADPAMFEEIRQRVREGRWAIVGGWFLQPDCNIPDGESFARHALISQRFFRDAFGVTARTGYNVDSFGHNASIPQILRRSGMENYVFMRPMEHEKHMDADLFLWQSPDGSRVRAYRIQGCYNISGEEAGQKIRDQKARCEAQGSDGMAFYGIGNHGGGPTVRLLKEIRAMNLPDTVFSTPDRFFDSVKDSKLPVAAEELQHHARGCYTACTAAKMRNRRGERNLLAAEALCLMATHLTGLRYPKEKLRKAWKNLLFNQFHDILGGCCVKKAYEDAGYLHGEIMSITEQAINLAMEAVAGRIDTLCGETLPAERRHKRLWQHAKLGTPVLVCNPHLWEVRATAEINGAVCRAADAEGREIPVQHVRGDQTNGERDKYHSLFEVRVPAYGYAVYRVFPDGEYAPEEGALRIGEYFLENPFLRAEFDPQSGELCRLTEKTNGRDLLNRPCRALLLDETNADTWAHNLDTLGGECGVFGEPVFSVTERGPVRATLRITQRFASSVIQRDYSLRADGDSLQVNTRIDFHERHRTLKFAFPCGADSVTAAIPYGTVKRAAGGGEEPCGPWLACGALGVANDGKYGYDTAEGEVRLSILRSAIYADHYGVRDEFCEYMEQGVHECAYALFAYTAPAEAERRARELNAPPRVLTVSFHGGTLPQAMSCGECVSPNAVVSAVKQAEDDDAAVVRFAEMDGHSGPVRVRLFERELEAECGPFQVRTFRETGEEVNLIEWKEEEKEDGKG